MSNQSLTNINVLTNESCPNSSAFNRPLGVIRGDLRGRGYRLRFCLTPKKAAIDADIVFVNSNVFRSYWRDRKDDIFRFLEEVKTAGKTLIWFDTTDSTWVTQFEVMPYVDLFLKSHLLKDRNLYLRNFRTGRVFTDFFDDLYKAGERVESFPALESQYMEKLAVSWAPCFETYDGGRYSIARKAANKIAPFTLNILPSKITTEFITPDSPRATPISARFGLGHSRPSVVAHRKAIADILVNRYGVDTGRVPLSKYIAEMTQAKVSVSPFGVGEFCYRDYESIACGAALVKPDMSHLETWPDLYQGQKTYISHKWDLSDFTEKLDGILSDDASRVEIAVAAQEVYKNAISKQGMEEFANRLARILGRCSGGA